MNRAQALNPLGNGCFEWREDIEPCRKRGRPRSVFVFEVCRYHAALGRPVEVTPRQRSRQRAHELAEQAVCVLKACRERLNIGQLCGRLGIVDPNHGSESRMLRRVLDRLHAARVVSAEGDYPRLYWTEFTE